MPEILNLQWRDVSLERREFIVQAVKAKTRVMRLVPITAGYLRFSTFADWPPTVRSCPATLTCSATRSGDA